jgi:2-oxo-3-(phosphooxy)propyl 3-oxoalkanoate synthase
MTTRLKHTSDHVGVVAGQQPGPAAQSTQGSTGSDALVTDLHIVGDDIFAVTAQWSGQHGFYGRTSDGAHDPLLFAETVRQAAMAIARRAFDAPMSDGYLPYQVSWEINADGLRATPEPVDLILTASAHDIHRKDGQVDRMRLEFDCYRDGYRVGFATQGWSAMTPSSYRASRGDNFGAEPYQATLLPAVEPDLVGRERQEDVVIAETPMYDIWSLQCAVDHPVLVEQPADHLPSTVILESARQVALRMVDEPRALPVRVEFAFIRCVEFDESCLIVANEDPPFDEDLRAVSMTFEQDGLVAATATVAVLLP